MTNQEKKDYLLRYRDNEREIVRTREELLRWESLARGTSARIGGAGGGSNGENKLQAAVERIVRWQNLLTAQIAERVKLREQIEAAIATVPDERLRILLRYRYIDGWTWERIAVELEISYQWVCHLHGKALEEIRLLDRS